MNGYSVRNDLREEGFVTQSPNSAAFQADLAKLLTEDEIRRAGSFLPYSLILVNGTGRYVWGFTVVYNFPDNIAPSGRHVRLRISRAAPGPADPRSMMAPGARYLVTPVASVEGWIDSAGAVTKKPAIGDDLEIFIRRFQSMHKGRMEFLADSIIYEDGILVGPDTQGMQAATNEQIRADDDLVEGLSGLTAGGLRGDALRVRLEQYAAGSKAGDYAFRLASQAESLRNGLQQHGEEWVLRQLRTVKWFGENSSVKRREY